MALGNMPESDSLEREQGLEREQRRLEINANLGRLKEVLLNKLNARRLQTRAIPVSPTVVSSRSSLVPFREVR